MNSKISYTISLGLLLGLFASSCDSFDNPNAASEGQVLTTVDGLLSLAIGVKREYQVNSLDISIRSSGLSARELGVVLGFTNPQDLEAGGSNVRGDNGIVDGIWSSSYRIMGMADDLIANADVIQDGSTRNALVATGYLFKAIAQGNLYMFWPSFPSDVDREGTGAFVEREEALNSAIENLNEGLSALGSGSVPSNYQTKVFGTNFDLKAVLNAYLARFSGFLGNNTDAIAAANSALGASTRSEWAFEVGGGNDNPMYIETTQEPPTYKPLDNFGIDSTEYVVPDEDGRRDFFLSPSDEIGVFSELPVEDMKGFFDEATKSIPVFLPGEMMLIKAEAEARAGNLTNAVTALNQVRTKTDDPFGVNAGLDDYSGDLTADAILEDIYLNRRVELFLIGTSLEDSRRFDRPIQSSPPDYTSYDRNRNYYPYPDNERANNPNTPSDPAI